MTSFGWKRKQSSLASTSLNDEFATDNNSDYDGDAVDWFTSAKRQRGGALEDAETKAERLKSDGMILAENGRYWEAIRLWDEAIALSPNNSRLHEMKTQALLELREDFAAVRAGEESVRCDPLWSVARQTLGRAQLNMGEVELAMRNFCIALHLSPWTTELREEDIEWTRSILRKAKEKETVKDESLERNKEIKSDEFSKMDVVRLRTYLL